MTTPPDSATASPLQAAVSLRNRPGFVWIDSSLAEGNGGLSLIGKDPEQVLEGGAGDWMILAEELKKRERAGMGLEGGAAVGYFRFDGSFRFGFYDEPMVFPGAGCLGESLSLEGIPPVSEAALPEFRPEITPEHYAGMVAAAQEYITSGDIYQVCLAHRFSSSFPGDPWPLYLQLRRASPAPHAAYLQLGDETVLSSSPECFLKMEGRSISTRPIKGTRPRGSDPAGDELAKQELTTSPKEIAELVMITDLERNDLGRVCDFGSVRTSELLRLERYAQVFHLVSMVEGRLRPEVSHVEALAACFPGGSISGAPKKRALEIIRELEPVPRGLFTGAIGYFGYNGESQFNIAIRTVVVRDGRAEFHAGAGITAGSLPEQEWEETLHKAAGILKAAGQHP